MPTRSRLAATTAAAVLTGLLTVVPSIPAAAGYRDAIDLSFPVRGPSSYTDSYSADRSHGPHQATDIMVDRVGQKVYAAKAGVITWITGLDGSPPDYGYMISIRGFDGREYHYVHLGRQNGSPAGAYAPGLRKGIAVYRGQHIGYAGCSGNASCIGPHLHFAIDDRSVTDPYGEHIRNPYRSLLRAERQGDYGWKRTPPRSTPVAGDWNGDGREDLGFKRWGRWTLRTSHGLRRPYFGKRGQRPAVGDFDGDGRDDLGTFRHGTWRLRFDRQGGSAERTIRFGRRGDQPIVGDWDGDGRDTFGVRRGRVFLLTNSRWGGEPQRRFRYGPESGRAVASDWDGDGRDQVGVTRGGTWWLANHWGGRTYRRVEHGSRIPVAGAWDGGQRDGIGRTRHGSWRLRLTPFTEDRVRRVRFRNPR